MANQTESEQYAFNAFANLPFYGSINSEFIELANVYDKKSIVDLGCGTGNITKLILKTISSISHFQCNLKWQPQQLEGNLEINF